MKKLLPRLFNYGPDLNGRAIPSLMLECPQEC